MSSIIENLKWRYAVQKFDTSKSVPEADLTTILEAGRLAATAYGLQPFDIVVVTDQAKKTALVPHAYGQTHAAENSVLLVLAARTDVDADFIAEYTARIETTRGLPAGSADGYKTVMVNDITNRTPEARLAWAKEQAFIALGTMMAAASEIRVDNHAMTGFDPAGFNTELGLDAKNLHATVLLTLGYRDASDDWQNYAKVRRSSESMIHTI